MKMMSSSLHPIDPFGPIYCVFVMTYRALSKQVLLGRLEKVYKSAAPVGATLRSLNAWLD